MTACNCQSCQNACDQKPGWFMPGEAEKLAEFFGTSFEEVFKTHLGVDWYEPTNKIDHNVFLLSPRVVDGTPGSEFGGDPGGRCVFFVNGLCSIHEVKPFECGALMHDDSHEEVAERHLSVAQAWDTEEHQAQIRTLLGREPESEVYSSPWSLFS